MFNYFDFRSTNSRPIKKGSPNRSAKIIFLVCSRTTHDPPPRKTHPKHRCRTLIIPTSVPFPVKRIKASHIHTHTQTVSICFKEHIIIKGAAKLLFKKINIFVYFTHTHTLLRWVLFYFSPTFKTFFTLSI